MDPDSDTIRMLGEMVEECIDDGSAARIATANAIGAVYEFMKNADVDDVEISEAEARAILEKYPYEFED
jgi:hypothetical protein